MTFFMEVEPPVATLPLRVPAAFSAVEEAAEATEEAVVEAEEAEPPQAVRAAAAAAAPQTARNERRVIFFIMIFLQIEAGHPPGSNLCCVCVFLGNGSIVFLRQHFFDHGRAKCR